MELISFELRTTPVDNQPFIRVSGEVHVGKHTVIRIDSNISPAGMDRSQTLYELQRRLLASAIQALQAESQRLPTPAASPAPEAPPN